MNTDMNFNDEVAAAEAELRAAQEKLDAAKARAAAQGQAQPQPQQPYQAYQPQQPQQPQQPYAQPGYQQSYAQPSYQQPNAQPNYQQPYPYTTRVSKDHVAAGLLAIFLGSLGIHKFYLGYNREGFILLAVTVLGSIFTLGLAAAATCIIAFIEGIIYLVKSQSDFERIYVFGRKEWF